MTQVHLACIISVINLLYAAHSSFGMDCGTQNEDSEVEDPISTGTEERILQGAEQTKPPHSEAEGKSESISEVRGDDTIAPQQSIHKVPDGEALSNTDGTDEGTVTCVLRKYVTCMP